MADPRVLVANRGEIAVRVIRTCREMGIPTVAVYSDADRGSLHVEMADEAYHIGPSAPAESYLNVPALLEVARRSGVTLVHPGYGFLAENADFARAAADAGLVFVGPPPEAMALMGDKAAARRTAENVGAPTVPGTSRPVSPDEALEVAARIGFPLVVKAAFGGGGKGMHLVRSPEDLARAVERSAREAKAYFGRPEVYLERYVTRAHHVEAQILADAHGHVSFLGERDCSVQRRYQKLIEESPSPIIGEETRARIEEAATDITRAAGYVNAGTVEFLVEEGGTSFYFMEMNARLQVEHPVTEMVTGLDLVRLQILVALGEPVEVASAPRGHAIECRLNAEDPHRDFLPGPGLVSRFRAPGGPFVRLDAGISEGRPVAGDYDSMFGKLVVWAEDRELARQRMLRALDELEVEGVPTTVPFHRWVLEHPDFRAGVVHTRWAERVLADGEFGAGEASTISGTSATPTRPARVVVEIDGRRVPVAVWGDDLRTPPLPPSAAGHGPAGAGAGAIVAPMQGTILRVMVEAGQEITAGQTVCILEAMKMENHIPSPREGTVAKVTVNTGDVVEGGQVLVVVE